MAGRHNAPTTGATRDDGPAGPLLRTGLLLGIGIAGFVDEAIFHQLLQWHPFYWATDQHGRILSDGFFHSASTLALLWGAFRLWRGDATWRPPRRRVILAGLLCGAGGFNAYDGLVQHVILHLHLVNEHVCPTLNNGANSILTCRADIPYEVVWLAVALTALGAGIALWRRARAFATLATAHTAGGDGPGHAIHARDRQRGKKG